MRSHKTSEIRRCSRFKELQPFHFGVFSAAVQTWTARRVFYSGKFRARLQALSGIHDLGLNSRLKLGLRLRIASYRCNLENSPTELCFEGPPRC
jgi:hypothetical protein